MSFIDQIFNAEATTKTPHLAPNSHGVLAIVKLAGSSGGHNGDYVVAEFTVESSSPKVAGGVVNAPGTKASTVWMFKHPGAQGRLKAFIASALGASDAEVKSPKFREFIDNALNENQILQGIKVRYETYPVTTKRGQEIQATVFTYIPEQDE